MSNTKERVIEIVAEEFSIDVDRVHSEMNFADDLGADSLAGLEFIFALEEEFEIEVPDKDAEKIATVQDALDYIKNKVGE